MKKYRHTIALLCVVVMALSMFGLGNALGDTGVNGAATAITIIGLWQLSQFALSKRRGACYIAALTPEQVKEFEGILRELKVFADDSGQLRKDLGEFKSQLDQVRRSNLARGGQQVLRPGQLVTDDCAEFLFAIAAFGAERKGKLDMVDSGRREALLKRSSSILGIEQRTALT